MDGGKGDEPASQAQGAETEGKITGKRMKAEREKRRPGARERERGRAESHSLLSGGDREWGPADTRL